MQQGVSLISTSPRLQTPRAAAIAGIVFSVLLIASLVLMYTSMPADLGSLPHSPGRIALALNLLPFSGVAFLWFIGVVRDRIGAYEDRFFATVFLGSGLLFLAMLFATGAVVGGTLALLDAVPIEGQAVTDVYLLGRVLTYQVMNVYAVKMAGVFMLSTSTIALRTAFIPRWMVYLGYALALGLLFSIGYVRWISVVFPLWTLVVSVYILIVNMRQQGEG